MVKIEIEQLKKSIGLSIQREDLVTTRLVEEYRATFGKYLAEVPENGAPLGLHWCLAPDMSPMCELQQDGHSLPGKFLPDVPLPRRMWAGGQVETRDILRIGDLVVKNSTIKSISVKAGRTGTLCFIKLQNEYSTDRGPAINEQVDLVYREAATAQPFVAGPAEVELNPKAVGQPCLTWELEVSPVLLFRYSALTFNAHRIHYDHIFASKNEGYAGLVVHGPLQASLLLNIATAVGSSVPNDFRYRGVAPLFVGGGLRVNCWRQSDGSVCCSGIGKNAQIGMEALAKW